MSDAFLTLAATAGAVALALSAMLWGLAQRRTGGGQADGGGVPAATEAFGAALICLGRGGAELVGGSDALSDCARALGVPAQAQAVVDALGAADPGHARRLVALATEGEPFTFEVRGTHGLVKAEGRASGAVAWLRLSPAPAEAGGEAQGLPSAARLADLLDARTAPAWLAAADGRPLFVNAAWLAAAGAAGLEDALARGATLDPAFDALARDAAQTGQPQILDRHVVLSGRRRALRATARPLEGGGVAVWSDDVTEEQEMAELLKRSIAAHDETLNHIAEAVAIFGEGKRLIFHNTAFAELWSLEPAWLADRPSHGEVLDRLRQRRRLPETVDYARWKAAELARYVDVAQTPDEMWSLPDGRTLRVLRQPHPMGGLLLLFSDITGELRLKSQYNAQIQVQQATLDKLTDAVAVFGSDGRLRLHNEAFETFWGVGPEDLAQAVDFEGVVELCTPRLHDKGFWRELKGRVADPDPTARAPMTGETRTSDGRIVAFQSRPLPDGATLIGFTDVTDARQLEAALAAREQALAEAERLKRDFVGNVSYELRTPLTTIIGYSELLERAGDTLSERGRSHAGAVKVAAIQLARSIDDVLDMAQIDADEMALDLADVDVADLLSRVAADREALATQQGITLEVACPPDIGVIRGDGRRLGQVLDHLVEHGLSLTPAGGRITLSARRALGEIQLQVADTGRGIPFHVQAHIFDRFVGRERGGPGLGLALVKALTELHGGWIALESEPGNGAAFTCHLPEEAHAGAAQPELPL